MALSTTATHLQSRPYRPIAEYGAIGEGRSVALVSPEGSIDWWCPGRFDAPSVFGAILDRSRGGRYLVRPTAVEARSVMRYVPDTNVLETSHVTSSGEVIVRDVVAFPEDTGVQSSVLLRSIVGVRGSVEMEIFLAPRFQYGKVAPRFSSAPHDITIARGAGEIVMLAGVGLSPAGSGAYAARVVVREGERLDLVLRHRHVDTPVPFRDPLAATPEALEAKAIERWRAWSAQTVAKGAHEALVRRAALTLKLLQYSPTGAIVAAPTTSLPEELGGVRNWDYRFTWLRDAALAAKALAECGHPDEGRALGGFLARALVDRDLRIMYTLTGSKELPEKELPHLEGYAGSRPVRIGNGAATQRQMDVLGELFEFAHAHDVTEPGWAETLRELADWVAAHWREPDSGIWEMRSAPKHFVLSKAMAWLALRKAAALNREGKISGDAAHWEREADEIRANVLAHGVDGELGFLQAYGHGTLDASNLLLPVIGFVDARDPRMLATVDATLTRLAVDDLVYRYRGGDDGVEGGEAAFAYCTFWLVEVLAMQGRVREARALFDKMAARATSLGLYAEEICPRTGEHLGNFPQGFPHAGLIQADAALRKAEQAT